MTSEGYAGLVASRAAAATRGRGGTGGGSGGGTTAKGEKVTYYVNRYTGKATYWVGSGSPSGSGWQSIGSTKPTGWIGGQKMGVATDIGKADPRIKEIISTGKFLSLIHI